MPRATHDAVIVANEWTMKPEVREFLIELYGEDGLPFTTRFGNGEPIGPEIVSTINDAYDACTIREPLRTHDILLVDNIATAHSRDPLEGDRKVVVALGDPHAAEVNIVTTTRRSRRQTVSRRR